MILWIWIRKRNKQKFLPVQFNPFNRHDKYGLSKQSPKPDIFFRSRSRARGLFGKEDFHTKTTKTMAHLRSKSTWPIRTIGAQCPLDRLGHPCSLIPGRGRHPPILRRLPDAAPTGGVGSEQLTHGNLALKNSRDNDNPVWVIRGHLSKNSYTKKVYTYDGLYKVVDDWVQNGV